MNYFNACTPEQFNLIQCTTALVPEEVRDWMLTRIADLLNHHEQPEDRQVIGAVESTLQSLHIIVPLGDCLEGYE
jgi:hypothetical protein